jgi:hypothetical protein
MGESLRDATEAIGEPRTVAYARPRVVWPQSAHGDD